MRMRHVWIRRAARREPLFLDVECCRVRCVGVREEPPAKELRLQRYDLSGLRLRNDCTHTVTLLSNGNAAR